MNTALTLVELASHFEYTPEGIDRWNIMAFDADRKLKGDCEDYALTSLYILSQHSKTAFLKHLMSGHAKLWYVRTTSGGHAVLQFDQKYIDNWSLTLTTKAHMESMGHHFDYTFQPITVAAKLGWSSAKKTTRKVWPLLLLGFAVSAALYLIQLSI